RSAERTARALRDARRSQSLRLRLRSRIGQSARLPLRSTAWKTDAAQSAVCANQTRRRAAAHGLPSRQPVCVRHQRNELDDHRISLRREGRRAERDRSEEHTSELQSRSDLVCRLLLEKKKK